VSLNAAEVKMSAWDDRYEYEREAAEAEFWEKLPKQLHEESVWSYLGVYGDAIAARVKRLTDTALALHTSGFYGPSITVSVTAIEVMIAYFCVRPMVEGAFVSETWADCLAGWVVGTRPKDQRKILVAILRLWDIEVEKILLDDKKPLWAAIQSEVFEARNHFVHRGDDVSKEYSQLGLTCIELFQKEIIAKIAVRLGFTLSKTGCWAHIAGDGPMLGGIQKGERRFTARDPFAVPDVGAGDARRGQQKQATP
jgi:hypothetical protein